MMLSSVQPHSAGRWGLAELHGFTCDENTMRCADHYCNQKLSTTEQRLAASFLAAELLLPTAEV